MSPASRLSDDPRWARPEDSDFYLYGRVDLGFDELIQKVAEDFTGVTTDRITHLEIGSMTGKGARLGAHFAFGVIRDADE